MKRSWVKEKISQETRNWQALVLRVSVKLFWSAGDTLQPKGKVLEGNSEQKSDRNHYHIGAGINYGGDYLLYLSLYPQQAQAVFPDAVRNFVLYGGCAQHGEGSSCDT